MRSLSLILGLLIAAPLSADEVRLLDGTVIVGSVVVKGKRLEIATRDGTVRVDRDQVLRIREEKELRVGLADLASRVANTGFGRLELARVALGWGLEPELWDHLDVALQLTPPGKRQRLAEFMATLEPEILHRRYRGRPTTSRVRELLRNVRANRSGKNAAIEELLVREPEAEEALKERARRAVSAEQRLVALAALSRRGAEGNDIFLYRTALLDIDRGVRGQAMKLAQVHGNSTDAVRYLAQGLLHSHPEVRIRTAKAFANLEDISAVKLLVEAGPKAGMLPQARGGGPRGVRSYMAITNQQAYIRDFDVQIAQAAVIADPVVGVVSSGVVLDVTVAAVVTHRIHIVKAYRSALRALVGSDPGADPRRWVDWLAERPANPGSKGTGR
jgi:hypothetical protein